MAGPEPQEKCSHQERLLNARSIEYNWEVKPFATATQRWEPDLHERLPIAIEN
jgi:hypothetical protein